MPKNTTTITVTNTQLADFFNTNESNFCKNRGRYENKLKSICNFTKTGRGKKCLYHLPPEALEQNNLTIIRNNLTAILGYKPSKPMSAARYLLYLMEHNWEVEISEIDLAAATGDHNSHLGVARQELEDHGYLLKTEGLFVYFKRYTRRDAEVRGWHSCTSEEYKAYYRAFFEARNEILEEGYAYTGQGRITEREALLKLASVAGHNYAESLLGYRVKRAQYRVATFELVESMAKLFPQIGQSALSIQFAYERKH